MLLVLAVMPASQLAMVEEYATSKRASVLARRATMGLHAKGSMYANATEPRMACGSLAIVLVSAMNDEATASALGRSTSAQ